MCFGGDGDDQQIGGYEFWEGKQNLIGEDISHTAKAWLSGELELER